MKRLLSLLLAVAMLVSLSACSSGKSSGSTHFEGDGFSTPEDAITAYLKAMKAGDVEEMISTFAVETYVDHYDLAAQIDQVRSLVYGNNNVVRLQPIDSYTRSLNIGQRTKSLYDALIWQYLYLTNSEMHKEYSGKSIRIPGAEFSSSEEAVDAVMDPDWLKNLSKLKVLNIENAESKFSQKRFFDTEGVFAEYQMDSFDIYGCQELVDMVVEFELDGKNYYLMLELACYEEKWYILTFNGYCSSRFGLPMDQGGIILADEIDE